MHRLFGYRGVILFSWCARVFDRTDVRPINLTTKKDEKKSKIQDVKTKSQIYYQVLIDNRDVAHIVSIANTFGTSFYVKENYFLFIFRKHKMKQ